MLYAAQLIRPARALTCFGAPLALFAAASTQAGAAVTETVSISNTYGFLFDGDAAPAPVRGGAIESFSRGNGAPNSRSELGIEYTAFADQNTGGFFFLHNNLCVGNCATFSQTVITFTLTNMGQETESIRFDSQITPGHLARIFGQEGMSASFQFDVLSVRGQETAALYSASGNVSENAIDLDTGGLAYNGLKRTVVDGQFEVVDWGKTNLSVGVGDLAPGAAMQVIYRATYGTSVTASCTDILACPGVQVVFGDPRNNGGVIDAAQQLRSNAELADPAVIGGEYVRSLILARFVNADAPLPVDPPTFVPPVYDTPFVPRAPVPEPASWALMILGFGAIGGALRRRNARPAVA